MKRHFDEENDKLSPQIHNVAVNAKRKEPEKKQTNRPSKVSVTLFKRKDEDFLVVSCNTIK
uniref:Uncharacterized protein n=1 Tax=Megaselia scalaris TaxID=36166 RepID=T1H2W9_MEGSC